MHYSILKISMVDFDQYCFVFQYSDVVVFRYFKMSKHPTTDTDMKIFICT